MEERKRKQQGFSLIEVVIVLVVMGLALSGLLMPMAAQMEKSARKETEAKLKIIQEALLGFAISNRRLPCPDTDADGQENFRTVAGTTVCDVDFGNLPYHALGVGQEDSWKRPFSYYVSPAFADGVDGTGCGTPTTGISFSLCSTGNLNVNNFAGNSVAQQLPAIVVSHGKAGTRVGGMGSEAPRSSHEQSNFSPTQISGGSATTKIHDRYSDEDYDDLVIWLSPSILKGKMVSAGLLP